MSKHNLPGLSPLWLISLSLVLGCWIVVSIPASIATGEAIKSSDWIGFGGNVVAGAMTLTAGIIAWFSVKGQIEAQEIAHARAQAELTTDLASILYAELAHLLARCCFDSESPWKDYWPESASVDKMDEARLRKFVPVDPVIYLATAGQLPLLGGAAQHLMEFQHRLSALRREIVNIANQAHLSNKVIEGKDVKLVGIAKLYDLGQGRSVRLRLWFKTLKRLRPSQGLYITNRDQTRTLRRRSNSGSMTFCKSREVFGSCLAPPATCHLATD